MLTITNVQNMAQVKQILNHNNKKMTAPGVIFPTEIYITDSTDGKGDRVVTYRQYAEENGLEIIADI